MIGAEEAWGEANGKIVLLGEHAVVHGSNAVAVALQRGARVRAEKKNGPTSLRIHNWNRSFSVRDGTREGLALLQLLDTLGLESEGTALNGRVHVPQRAGLGSSAALAAAIARALVSFRRLEVTDQLMFEAVQASERVFHGNPSGLDASMALQGGAALFSRSLGVRPIKVPSLPIAIFHSGEHGDTGEMVRRFEESLKSDGDEGIGRLRQFYEVIDKGIQALSKNDLESLGRAMNDNHDLLKQSGVSTSCLDKIVNLARDSGALGAKLTGGGGGGCAIVLTDPGDLEVVARLNGAGFKQVDTR